MIAKIVCIALCALLLYPFLVYIHDPKKLRRFPAPARGLAGVHDVWALRHHWRNDRYAAVRKAHQDLGPVVRIMPHHLSFRDPRALKDIYGHGSPLMKSEYYDNIAGSVHDVANSTDRAEHTRKRRMMSHIFSHKQVIEMESVINDVLKSFVSALDQRTGQEIDMRYWFNLFTFDAISSLAFSNSLCFLQQGHDATLAETANGATYEVKIVGTFHDATSFAAMVGHANSKLSRLLQKACRALAHRGARAFDAFGAFCTYQTNQRLAQSGRGQQDFFTKIEAPQKETGESMPHDEMVAEAGIMLNAGSDTTASGLTNTLWLLVKHPEVLRRLRIELQAVMSPGETQPSFDKLMAVPYLRACLDESLRLRPPVAIGLPRVTPAQGATICGHFIPGGVTVSSPIIELNTHEGLFADPHAFRPERWFDETQLPNLREYSQPFSIGGRACIGRNLAMIELTKVIAVVVTRYDIAIEQEQLAMVERFNMNPGCCHAKLARIVEQPVAQIAN